VSPPKEFVGFNPTLVRLRPPDLAERFKRDAEVSIPRWFD